MKLFAVLFAGFCVISTGAVAFDKKPSRDFELSYLLTRPSLLPAMSLVKPVQSTYYGGCGQTCNSNLVCSSDMRPEFRDGVCTRCVGESTSGQRC